MAPTPVPTRTSAHEKSLAAGLDSARRDYWEEPGRALTTAIRAEERARALRADDLRARAIAVQAAISVHRGDLQGAFSLAADAERFAGNDPAARAEIAALYAHLHYFSGSYAEALRCAEQGILLADATEDLLLRLHVRRMGCVAFGNIGVEDIGDRFEQTLALALEAKSPWEEAIVRNDLACFAMAAGDLDGAAMQLEESMAIASDLEHNRFLLSVLHCTRSELRLEIGSTKEAVRDATRAVGYLVATDDDVNPYLLGMAILVLVKGLLASGRLEDARLAVDSSLSRLGERVPQTRSMILASVAQALNSAGRHEEAYDMLARSAALAHKALQDFSHLQVGMERERLTAVSARRQADALAARNRKLEIVVDELRDEADKDPLTGLHNRRYLARVVSRPGEAVSFAIADVDHFKAINDSFGHIVGDRVLKRIAALFASHMRGEDVVMRIGGEEFALLMPGASPGEALAACERLRSVIADEPWGSIAPGLAVTTSFGLASGDGDIDSLQLTADARLYAAKRGGRNRVAA